MKHSSLYLLLIILFVVLDFVWEQFLAYRNRKKMSPQIPAPLAGIYNADEYARQQSYQKENSRFSLYSSLVSFVVLLVVLSTGLFGWLDGLLRVYVSNPIVLSLVFLGVIFVVNTILSLPFTYYNTFVIEQRFGFNKSTKRLFWMDHLKSFLMTIVIGGVLLALIAWFFTALGRFAWFYAWLLVTVFTLFMTLFYSNIIVPLFNKQTPLEEGELRSAIEAFGAKAGFEVKNIYVMDASKRSTKANAYFTGLGRKKRIVLFDSLINDLSTDEIVAVLAHEIGHYKRKHTLQTLVLSICFTAFILYLLSLFLSSVDVAVALGSNVASFHMGLIAFSILFTPISLVWGVLTNMLSRRNEYQADGFAAAFGCGKHLIEGLKKLSVKSLSNLNPDALLVFCHYSHPTLLQRMQAIESDENKNTDCI